LAIDLAAATSPSSSEILSKLLDRLDRIPQN